MREGAMGLSTSLLMPPSNLITTAQLIELAKVARQYGGIYSTHMRDEGAGVFRSVEESIDIGKGANIRVDIIHLKIADKKFWGQMNEIISMINKARTKGYDVRANVYPYTAGQNDLSRHHSAVGPRRRQREDAGALAGSRATRADEEGHPERPAGLV